MQSWFTFELDGEICRIENESSRGTLAGFLADLDPLFSHYAESNPWHGGAPVILGEINGIAPRFRCVDANLILLPMLADTMVWTPEGIASLDPGHPAVGVLGIEHVECGEARRMAILSLFFEGYYRPDLRRNGQINEQLDCLVSRTSDVNAIRDAARRLFASAETKRHEASQRAAASGSQNEVWTGKKDIDNDRFTKALFIKKPVDSLDYVDRHKYRFHRPLTLADLQRLRSQYPDAKVIAGGTHLIENLENMESPTLISIKEVAEMQMIRTNQEFWEIGAGVNLTRVSEAIGGEYPAFLKALTKFGSRLVRNRATLGGYLAVASDTGQLAPLLIAMDARLILLSADGERNAPISHFYEGGNRTILRPGELIRCIMIPRGSESALSQRGMTTRLCDTYTVGPRRCLCEPYITGAFAVELREKTVAKAWVAYTGVANIPVRARQTEDFLAGRLWSEETVFAALNTLFQEIQVTKKDVGHASADYRKQLVMTLFQKFFYQHPTPRDVKPVEQGITQEFSLHDQPFFDSVV
ncbi:MAG: FAD binding domain-containing protein [Verrucomicrobiales bacterium]|nr:FAD binding domain-containing protein [Verrucomicrobiales bacterium]